jgi:hypothetical protein
MKKTSCFSIVALCLCTLTASAGTLAQSALQSEAPEPGLHILAMSPAEQLDFALWTRGAAAARELPALWEGVVFNGPVASVRSAPLGAPAGELASGPSGLNTLFAPGPSPFSFMLLAAGLALGSYALRRTRISALAACG